MKSRLAIFDPYLALREMFAQVLEKEGYTVIAQSESGLKALELLENQAADLVILDLLLTELNGLDVLPHLKAMPRPPKAFVFTTSDNREMLREAHLAQPQGFVHKADRLATICEALRLSSSQFGFAGTI